MEHPSRELVQQLGALGLASAADLRRCAGRVRRLARGLPATDSVWMDALVLRGKISPYQARALETDRSNELVIGRKFVLRTPLHLDPLLSTFSAQMPGRRERVHVSRMPSPPNEGEAAALRLLKTIKNLSILKGQLPFLPFDAMLERDEVFLIAPLSEGDSLARLLVRRGRFPEAIVRIIAQELLRPLQAAESIAVHGDLRSANLWVSRRGELHLLNWGLLDAVCPEITIHSRLPLDACDGLAPERVDSAQRTAPASDIYSLGCLLWQLLTGRPPHPVADPLAKMAAHRQRQVADVRTLAPDVSESFSLLLRNMTTREAHRRPQGYAEISQIIGPSSAWNRRRLQQFFQQFETNAPRQSSEVPTKSRVPALAGTAVLTAGLCLAAWNREHLGWPKLSSLSAATAETKTSSTLPADLPAAPLSSDQPVPTRIAVAATGSQNAPAAFPSDQADSPVGSKTAATPLQPLPSPTLEGVLNLSGTEPYAAGPVMTGETLVLKGTSAAPAVIRIQDLPLVLEAGQIRLEHVRLVIDTPANPQKFSPVQLRCKTLSVHQTVLQDHRPAPQTPVMHWQSGNNSEANPARLLIHESRIETSAAVLSLDVPLAAARFDHVLVRGAASLMEARQGAAPGLRAPVILNFSTLRDCRAAVALPDQDALQPSGQISLQGEETVISLQRGAPLVSFPRVLPPPALAQHLEVNAQGLIVEMGTMLAGSLQGPAGNPFTEIPSDSIRVDGLLSGDFHFEPVGTDGIDRHQVVIDALPVRQSSERPGVRFDRLPRE